VTRDEIAATIADILRTIAPEADLARLPPDAALRDELDLDSMDFLNVMIAINERLDVEVPEADHAKLATLAACIDYVASARARREQKEHRMPSHEFTAHLTWQRTDGAGGTHEVAFDGRPSLSVAAAPQYRGDPSRLNPEELFVASLASCQFLTYLALAPRAGVTVLAYDDRSVGTLTIVDKKMRMAEVVLRPRITIDAATDDAKARALVNSAHEGCFIANSVRTTVRLEPEIVRG
jgi:acyl carrier protein